MLRNVKLDKIMAVLILNKLWFAHFFGRSLDFLTIRILFILSVFLSSMNAIYIICLTLGVNCLAMVVSIVIRSNIRSSDNRIETNCSQGRWKMDLQICYIWEIKRWYKNIGNCQKCKLKVKLLKDFVGIWLC